MKTRIVSEEERIGEFVNYLIFDDCIPTKNAEFITENESQFTFDEPNVSQILCYTFRSVFYANAHTHTNTQNGLIAMIIVGIISSSDVYSWDNANDKKILTLRLTFSLQLETEPDFRAENSQTYVFFTKCHIFLGYCLPFSASFRELMIWRKGLWLSLRLWSFTFSVIY